MLFRELKFEKADCIMSERRVQPSLSIVIPALNEEQAIGSTIERCFSARLHIKESHGLAAIERLVLS